MPQFSESSEASIEADVALVQSIGAIARILDVVCKTTGMGFAAVARVTDQKWIACAVRDELEFGLLPGGELELKTTLCDEIRDSREPVVIDHVSESALYRTHHTPRIYGLESYISFPIIRANGEMFGTLCAIDPAPHHLSGPETQEMFRLFAELIAFHLDTSDQLEASQGALSEERATATLRDQFIAILGHDLRNPVASIEAGITLLQRSALSDRDRSLVQQMAESARRISRLIDDVLDFARGQLGGGLSLALQGDEHIRPVIEQVVSEIQQSHPDRVIRTDIALNDRVASDPDRIGQLLSNLLGNAMSHGAPDQPVNIRAHTQDGVFVLSVSNGGKAIPSEALPNLFMPFTRAAHDKASGGLGLGLYIASKIAEAHKGTLTVESDDTLTKFTLRIVGNTLAD